MGDSRGGGGRGRNKRRSRSGGGGGTFSGQDIFTADQEDMGDMSLPVGSAGRGMTADETLNVLRTLQMLRNAGQI